MSERHATSEPGAATRDAIRAAVEADLAPVRARSFGVRAAIVVAGVALAVATAAPAFGMNPAGATPDRERATIAGAVMTLVGTLAMVGAFAPSGRPRLGARGKLVALGVLLVGWTGYLLVIATAPAPASGLQTGALACGLRSIMSGLFAGFAAIWAFRYADPWTPRRTGALIGAASGCIAAAAVDIGCGVSDLGHLLVGHGLVVPLLAVAGALVARRTLRP